MSYRALLFASSLLSAFIFFESSEEDLIFLLCDGSSSLVAFLLASLGTKE